MPVWSDNPTCRSVGLGIYDTCWSEWLMAGFAGFDPLMDAARDRHCTDRANAAIKACEAGVPFVDPGYFWGGRWHQYWPEGGYRGQHDRGLVEYYRSGPQGRRQHQHAGSGEGGSRRQAADDPSSDTCESTADEICEPGPEGECRCEQRTVNSGLDFGSLVEVAEMRGLAVVGLGALLPEFFAGFGPAPSFASMRSWLSGTGTY